MTKKKSHNKSATGAGYTVRVEGKKILTTSLLQEQVQQQQALHNELVKQNELLRAKEAMQMTMLDNYDKAIPHLSALVDLCPAGPEHDSAKLTAGLLEAGAKQLRQQLQPAPASSGSKDSLVLRDGGEEGGGGDGCGAGSSSGASARQQGAAAAGDSSTNNSGNSSGFISQRFPAMQQQDAPDGSATQRWLASITQRDVQDLQGITVEGLAERFRNICARLALAQRVAAGRNEQGSERVERAMDEMGRLCFMAVIAAEQQMSQIVGLNLETLEKEAPPADVWSQAIDIADMQPQQRKDICMAFQCFRELQGALLQEQKEVKQRLDEVLGQTPRAMQSVLLQDQGALAAAAAGGAAPGAPAAGSSQHQLMSAAAGVTPQNMRSFGWPFDRPELPSPARAAAVMSGFADTPAAAAASGSSSSQQSPPSSSIRETPAEPPDGEVQQPAASAASNSVDGPAGVLTLEDAEHAEHLLQDLMRIARCLKQQSRRLACTWFNLLSADQHADIVLTCYPFSLNVPSLCACVWQVEQQREEEGKRRRRRTAGNTAP